MDLHGLFPPIPTAFHPDGSLALESLEDNLKRWGEEPLAGFVVGGSNGEFVLLTDEERVTVVEAARRAIPPDRLLIAGAGTQATGRTISLGRRMAEAGADALLVVTPHYYRGLMTAEVLIEHYRSVAEALPAPLILYNVPANTGLNLPLEAIRVLAEHPNIIGIKDSSGDLVRMADIVRQTPDEFAVLAGSGSFVLPALSLGAIGAIAALANIAAAPMAAILRHSERGEQAQARALQLSLLEPNRAVTASYGVPGLKAALDMIGYYGGPVRRPLQPLDEGARSELRSILSTAGLLPA